MLKQSGFLVGLICIMLALTSCQLATVRSLSDDEEAKAGFNPDFYVDEIWETQFIPTFMENAVEINQLLSEIQANKDTAIASYGSRSGTGSFSFMTQGEARVLDIDLESRIGLMSIDLAPFDGQPDANIAIGPAIRRRNNAAIDAVGFIRFNDFVNQTEFASVSDAIKQRILVEVLEPLDLESLKDQTIAFHGAFTLEDTGDLEIVPVRIEVR
jgi:predicted lipoprotein